jgi:hypothetical protein
VLSDAELWATDTSVTKDVATQWEQILSEAYAPHSFAIQELHRRDTFQGWLRRWRIDDLALVDGNAGSVDRGGFIDG